MNTHHAIPSLSPMPNSNSPAACCCGAPPPPPQVINGGGVPALASTWGSVVAAECRRAQEAALETYRAGLDKARPPEVGGGGEGGRVGKWVWVTRYG